MSYKHYYYRPSAGSPAGGRNQLWFPPKLYICICFIVTTPRTFLGVDRHYSEKLSLRVTHWGLPTRSRPPRRKSARRSTLSFRSAATRASSRGPRPRHERRYPRRGSPRVFSDGHCRYLCTDARYFFILLSMSNTTRVSR